MRNYVFPLVPNTDLEQLYQNIILDHFKYPRKQTLVDCNTFSSIYKNNPLCGDQIDLQVGMKADATIQICYQVKGCVISQASASILSHLCVDKTYKQVSDLIQAFKNLFATELNDGSVSNSQLGDAFAFISLRQFPVRQRCALLAWEALLECLAKLDAEHHKTKK